jgi:hypothetical protein
MSCRVVKQNERARMSSPKSLLRVAGIAFGCLGIVVCVTAAIFLWMASTRLRQISDSLFSKMDESLVKVHERVSQIHERVSAASLYTKDLDETLRDWVTLEAGKRLALHQKAGEISERLAARLQLCDVWLDVAESTLAHVQDMMEVDSSAGAPADPTLVSQLIAEVKSLRAQLAEAMDIVATVQQRAAENPDSDSEETRIGQAVALAKRVVATLGAVDSRLESLTGHLSTAQVRLQALKSDTRWWILIVTIAVTLLVLLMAAGQVALCRLAWVTRSRA